MTLAEIEGKPEYKILLVVDMQQGCIKEKTDEFKKIAIGIAELTKFEGYSCDTIVFVEDPMLNDEDFKSIYDITDEDNENKGFLKFTGKETPDELTNLLLSLTDSFAFKSYISWLTEKCPDLEVEPSELFTDFLEHTTLDFVGNNENDRCKNLAARILERYKTSIVFLDHFIYPFVDYLEKAKEQKPETEAKNESGISSIHTES